jgi:hypothetical protein
MAYTVFSNGEIGQENGHRMDALFQIVTMIIPKAGVQIGGIPLTLNLLLLALVLIRNPNQTIISIQRRKVIGVCYAVLLFFALITFLLGVLEGFSGFVLAQIATVIASPLAGVIGMRMRPEQSFRILALALIVVGMYAAAQFAMGVEHISIEGLTYTAGQELTDKPIGWGTSGDTDTALKMPSTFQNGNYLGIFDALGISLILMWKPVASLWKTLKYFAVGCGILGIMLCGSRSTVIPFVLVAFFLLAQEYRATSSRMKGTYLAGASLAIIGGIIYMLFFQQNIVQQFITRNLTQTVADPTAAGRTTQWSDMAQGIVHLNGAQLLRLAFFGQGAGYNLGGEGMPTFFVTFGLFGTVAFYGMLIAAIIYLWKDLQTRTVALGVFCAFFAFCVDSSFYYPPNVMMVFVVVGIAFSATKSKERQCALIKTKLSSAPASVSNLPTIARNLQ